MKKTIRCALLLYPLFTPCFGQIMSTTQSGNLIPRNATFASPPSAPATGSEYTFTDASATGVCSGGGSAIAKCRWSGSAWQTFSGTGGGTGTVTSVGLVGTANQLTVTGTSPITSSGSWTISIPNPFTLPGLMNVSASATGGSGLNLAAGTAPTSPASGDFWNTGTLLQFRNNAAATKTVAFLDSNITGTAAGLSSVLSAASGGSGVANTATHTLGSSNQNWATLGTGIVKNTTTTGAITNAVAADVYGLWSGTCSSSTFLRGDGSCQTTSSGGTSAGSANAVQASNGSGGFLDSGCTAVSGVMTCAGGSSSGYHAMPQGTANTAPANSVGFQAPTSVTSAFLFTLPGAPAAGFMRATNATPSVISVSGIVAADLPGTLSSGTAITNAALTTPAITGVSTGSGVATAATASTLALRNASGEVIAANTVATGKTPMATDTVLVAAQEPAHTGDVTNSAGSLALALVNIPTATPAAGSLLATAITAPGTPAAGKGSIYVDSTSKNLSVKDDAGVVKHGVQTDTGTANNYISAISDAGAITKSRPACATLSDSTALCSTAPGTGVATFLATPSGANFNSMIAAGGIPVSQNSQSTAYTLVLADGGGSILHPTADNNARTFTIPANASVAYPVGTTITFVNQINTVTIAITTDTLQLAGSATTGSRTLAAGGMATAIKVTSTLWYISGPGLT